MGKVAGRTPVAGGHMTASSRVVVKKAPTHRAGALPPGPTPPSPPVAAERPCRPSPRATPPSPALRSALQPLMRTKPGRRTGAYHQLQYCCDLKHPCCPHPQLRSSEIPSRDLVEYGPVFSAFPQAHSVNRTEDPDSLPLPSYPDMSGPFFRGLSRRAY